MEAEQVRDMEYVDVPTFYECSSCGRIYGKRVIEEANGQGKFWFKRNSSILVACPGKDCEGRKEIDGR